MGGIDLLLSRDLASEIKKGLDADTLSKIERDLFFQHGMSIKLSIEHFEKLHDVIKDHSNIDIKNFEKTCLQKIVQIFRSDNHYEIDIISPSLSEIVFNYFGDMESRKILLSIMNEPLTVPEILSKSGILKSPAYRKIENLLLDGIILESGKIMTNNKRVSQYQCIFDQVNLVMENGVYRIKALVDSKYFKESSMYNFGLLEPEN
ncbi:MAG: transcriptional regulator [Nitrosopumilus sp.]|uniref:Transcriptional regulator n=2 Tax=Candidatus Nitrosomaritimum aestuariumsis TaxID=3342354 RepID=A0AC60W9Z3_9ARCH|nr:transcriptional regulator [Nitrosopumilaceae archaeon]MBA4461644.1 transcriptional regulator [Nitrosopumilaceae archaeon]MBA4464098.1 transcriptional regulator [Nitrosopumilaceae archaeon]